ncbi:hypothetical protein BGZ65_005650 [Modicella reniformis]|uniref:Uncharacterized protein n=1 Tax=Modicella reniformis TaxID=1440133 RepID=A0A9P6M2K1_9FUNG|nr:hypothetical protein BGZ65_005650 [Modicella reniformis]
MEAQPLWTDPTNTNTTMTMVSLNLGPVTEMTEVQWERLLVMMDHIKSFTTRLTFNDHHSRNFIRAMTAYDRKLRNLFTLYRKNGQCMDSSQMGRLIKLKHLTVGWSTTMAFSSRANLDMSLKSGLGHLSELKTLEVLDVNHLYHLEIGMEEIQWMAEQWPELTRIHGLEYRMSDPPPDYIVQFCFAAKLGYHLEFQEV